MDARCFFYGATINKDASLPSDNAIKFSDGATRCMLTGPPGSVLSTMAFNYAMSAAKAGRNVLYFTSLAGRDYLREHLPCSLIYQDNSNNISIMQRILMKYPIDYAALCMLTVSIPSNLMLPSVIIVDRFDDFIANVSINRRAAAIAMTCAMLVNLQEHITKLSLRNYDELLNSACQQRDNTHYDIGSMPLADLHPVPCELLITFRTSTSIAYQSASLPLPSEVALIQMWCPLMFHVFRIVTHDHLFICEVFIQNSSAEVDAPTDEEACCFRIHFSLKDDNEEIRSNSNIVRMNIMASSGS